jgi:hypothetical protein
VVGVGADAVAPQEERDRLHEGAIGGRHLVEHVASEHRHCILGGHQVSLQELLLKVDRQTELGQEGFVVRPDRFGADEHVFVHARHSGAIDVGYNEAVCIGVEATRLGARGQLLGHAVDVAVNFA